MIFTCIPVPHMHTVTWQVSGFLHVRHRAYTGMTARARTQTQTAVANYDLTAWTLASWGLHSTHMHWPALICTGTCTPSPPPDKRGRRTCTADTYLVGLFAQTHEEVVGLDISVDEALRVHEFNSTATSQTRTHACHKNLPQTQPSSLSPDLQSTC